MSSYTELTAVLTSTINKVGNGTISLAKAKVIDRMVNSVIRLAILQVTHAAPASPLEIGFRNESTTLLEETDKGLEK